MAETSAKKSACAEAFEKLKSAIVRFAVAEQPRSRSRMTPCVAQGCPWPQGLKASKGPLSPLHQ